MKILAVIPARSGSKGIPNKNIRLLAGYPMIYYAINNAKKSNYISDIIVTTDSPEIQIIASQMGVDCKWRSFELCKDDVTLDAVVYDAIPNSTIWDYIITLQPTSPTLSVKTLDQAIRVTMDLNLDTLISVVNSPHLTWRDEGGIKIPNYTKRLNRQYLAPLYVETGTFLITKACFVSPESRIGPNVDVFEVPADEAIDIDNFDDLYNAANILCKEKVAIYVNGNNTRGIGHIYRALEMADEFYTKPDIYYDSNQTDPSVFGITTHSLISVNGIGELFEKCKINQYTIFINDILSTSIDYMIGLRTVLPKAKIINFEDDGEGAIKADAVFNALYDDGNMPHIYGGEQYYISGKLLLFYHPITIKEKVSTIFICFGGADPENYTDRILEIIVTEKYKDYHFIVALGRAKTNIKSLLEYNHYPNIEVIYDVSNMPELMSKSDIAIASRGRTCYELAMLGIPTISIAENDRENRHSFVSGENGFAYLGIDPENKMIEEYLDMYLGMSQKVRQHYQNILISHNLRNGRKNVMNIINNL